MKKRILLIGGGGHCRSVIDSLLSTGEYNDIGIVDSVDTRIMGIPIVGNDNDLPLLREQGWTDAFISVGSIGSTDLRRKLYQLIKEIGFTIPIIMDPSSAVAEDVVLGEGLYIGKRAVVNAGSRIGICSIINSGAIVEHECHIGDFSHISPGAVLCGNVDVGNDTHIGAGSVVKQGIMVGQGVLIGAGSIVLKNIYDGMKAYGNPCKVVE